MRRLRISAARKEAIQDAMARALDREADWQRRRLSYLSLVVTVAPLIGLLGTIWGMLETFNSLACHAPCFHNHLAWGILAALVTTWMGLAVAIPARALLHVLQNRSQRALLLVEAEAKRLMAPLIREPGPGGDPPVKAHGCRRWPQVPSPLRRLSKKV